MRPSCLPLSDWHWRSTFVAATLNVSGVSLAFLAAIGLAVVVAVSSQILEVGMHVQ